ncbi:MAG: hypothetical protein GF383_08095 [Candidatus Lokiarchaeota archaeon]|nr:hypothetical protein [Candidatus Lokiarchaeota archaeon]MBD3340292.1 hypothetical protein [Candidatus Lokiarchaeota archaeon]
MNQNSLIALAIVSLLAGASGLGLGAYTMMQYQNGGADGEDGEDGDEGVRGEKGEEGLPGSSDNISVSILNPDPGETISGEVLISAKVFDSDLYTPFIYLNGTERAISIFWTWNTILQNDGWWNITILVYDSATSICCRDEVIVYVLNENINNEYYCSTQSEIEQALININTGYGTIIITQDITLTSQIDINHAGNYVIKGSSPITLERSANDEIFSITNVQSLTIKDISIQVSGIISWETPIIFVDELQNNPIYIQNVKIAANDRGKGIYIVSENVRVENCIIRDVNTGIHLYNEGDYCHITENSIYDLDSTTGPIRGIYLQFSSYNTITGNIINDIVSTSTTGSEIVKGISLSSSSYNSITGNSISDIHNLGTGWATGISLESNHYSNTVSGNSIYDITSKSNNAIGIRLDRAYYSSINDNSINTINSTGGDAYGLYLMDCTYNSLSGNSIYYVRAYTSDAYGIYIYEYHSNSINSNSISSISSHSGNAHGLYIYIYPTLIP